MAKARPLTDLSTKSVCRLCKRYPVGLTSDDCGATTRIEYIECAEVFSEKKLKQTKKFWVSDQLLCATKHPGVELTLVFRFHLQAYKVKVS